MIINRKTLSYRPNALSHPLIKNWIQAFIAFGIVRLLLSFLAAAIVWDHEPMTVFVDSSIYEARLITVPDQGRLAQLFINPWYRWDTGWFLKIAALGYSATDGSVIYPPLFPLLIRIIAPLFGKNYLLTALIISNLSCLLSFYLFRAVIFEETGSTEITDRAFVFLLAFPSAFYLFSAYSEAPFLAAALGAWLFARRENWFWAGVLGALAALVRLQGWLLVIPFAWMIFSGEKPQRVSQPMDGFRSIIEMIFNKDSWSRFIRKFFEGGWAAIILPVLAFLGYQIWLEAMGLGSTAQAFRNFGHLTIIPPWDGLAAIFTRLLTEKLFFVDWIDFSLFTLTIGLSLIAIFKLKLSLSIYLWATLGLILMRGYSVQLMAGFSRYALTLFPLFILLARNESWIIRNILIVLFFLFHLLFAWLFLNWFWVA